MGRERRRGKDELPTYEALAALVPEVVGAQIHRHAHTPLPVRIEPDVEGILEQGPMSFGNAMQAVCQGAEVRRAGWGDDPTVVFLKDGTLTLRGASGQDRTVVVTEGDIQNDDWVMVPPAQAAGARMLL
jgi:hypothetical protein